MTFNDLVFKPHSIPGGRHATVKFPNGYGASVVSGAFFYTDAAHPYELAVMKGGDLCYTTPITDDVCGHLDEGDVTDLLQKIAALPSCANDAE